MPQRPKNGYQGSSFEDDCIVFTAGAAKLGENSFRGVTLDTMNGDYIKDALEMDKNTFRNFGSELSVKFSCTSSRCCRRNGPVPLQGS